MGMIDHWASFWSTHPSAGDHPQRQVLRTLHGAPIDDTQFERILQDIDEKLGVCADDTVLDLCCGNGLITQHIARQCKHVTGVDFSQVLVDEIDTSGNVSVVVGNVLEVEFGEDSFDKVLMYAGLQYLSYSEVVCLFVSVRRWLRDEGAFFIGDIPDLNGLWRFFDTDARKRVYFDSVRDEKPVVGTWFPLRWLMELGSYAGFSGLRFFDQPADMPYSHYRFDMVLR